jgi:bifunctional enzyme Fae/Hps
MYQVGEALLGSEPEVAHIDLIIGKKDGPVGIAFANALSSLSAGHTPLLAVIRPNLLTKPSTLIIPKVTITNLKQAEKIFGPAQYAVGRAVVDAVAEGIIPSSQVEDLVIICSVFIHPNAKDFKKIYHYNYGATKLALRRALSNYPSIDKLNKEKEKASHIIMGFRIRRLFNPPYLQVALDVPNIESLRKVLTKLPFSDKLLLEAGTPLIKRYGLEVIGKIRDVQKDAFIIADLKTLDVGRVEVRLAFDCTADAVSISGLAPLETIEKAIHEAKKCGIYAYLDMMNVTNPITLLSALKNKPDVVLLHRGIDQEITEKTLKLDSIDGIRKILGKKVLIALAGGIKPSNLKSILKIADIIIVGRYIIKSRDIEASAREFLRYLGDDIDLMRLYLDDDEHYSE